jgi:hypothetical protein
MLRELRLTQNDSSGIRKRWFQDDYFDLFTWQELTGKVTSFQLCYDRLGRERVISWDIERGFGHHLVDDGESSPHKNMSPVFVVDGPFSSREVIPKFVQASHQISEKIRTFTMQKLLEYVEQQANG